MSRAENLAIMLVDMAGFAERTARQSRQQNQAMLRAFYGLLAPLVARFGGRRIKSMGDALLVTFRSPTDSVRCGMAMHDAVTEYNQRRPQSEPIRIRVALNCGEVRIDHGDVFGEAVNIAARVEELTPPGEIYLTGVVYLSMNKAEVAVEHIGEAALKGVPEAVRLFRVPARRLARLQPAGEELDSAPGELPYGGMHALPPDSSVLLRLVDAVYRAPYVDWRAAARRWSPKLVTMAGATALAALAAMAFWVWPTAAPQPVATHAGESARQMLALAHSAFHERRRSEAAALYAKALELDPALRHDSGLAANLVGTLSWGGEAPMQTLRQFSSPEVINELSRRTGQPGHKGARRAAALLEEAGAADRIDRLGLAINELSEAASCQERLAAVRTLRTLRDPRGVPALRQALERGVAALFRADRNACLRAEAEQAVAELERAAALSRTPGG